MREREREREREGGGNLQGALSLIRVICVHHRRFHSVASGNIGMK